jgi:ABC-2 type transport system ATP-binding protein
MADPGNDIILKVDNVAKHFKEVKAVDGVSLEVARGEFVALLGPNGAGKTTMVEMIEGLQQPKQGTILIDGKTWKNNEKYLQHLIGISLQETYFFDKIKVRETLEVFSSFYNLPKSRIAEILEIAGLASKEKSYVENLSGGQRQKLALGIAMLHNAKLLLLDEPTTGLDPSARREIWNILLGLKKNQQTSMILTTHYMEEAEFLCDRIIIMDKGKILAQGTLEQLLEEKGCYEIIEFSINESLVNIDLLAEFGFTGYTWDTSINAGKLQVFSIVDQLPALMKVLDDRKLTLRTLECRKMTLDDLFIEMTGRRLEE